MELQAVTKIELAIVATYVVQKLGQPTLGDVQRQLDKLGVDLTPLIAEADDEFVLKQVLGSMKKRDIIAQNKKQVGERGHSRTFYSMKKIKFATMPEAAHVKDLLPKLIATDEAKEVKRMLDGFETEIDEPDAKDKKSKTKRAKYTDAHVYSVVFELKERLYAGRMLSPSLKDLIDKSKYQADTSVVLNEDGTNKKPKKGDEINIDRYFDRADNGDIIFHSCMVRGWFSATLPRLTPHGESVGKEHCGFDAVIVKPDVHGIKLTELPVQPSGFSQGGSVPQTCETIMPGERLLLRFWAPTRGFMPPKDIEWFVGFLGKHARRHLSAGRGTETGQMEMVAFVDNGHVWDDIRHKKTDVDFDREIAEAVAAATALEPKLKANGKNKGKKNGGKSIPMFSDAAT